MLCSTICNSVEKNAKLAFGPPLANGTGFRVFLCSTGGATFCWLGPTAASIRRAIHDSRIPRIQRSAAAGGLRNHPEPPNELAASAPASHRRWRGLAFVRPSRIGDFLHRRPLSMQRCTESECGTRSAYESRLPPAPTPAAVMTGDSLLLAVVTLAPDLDQPIPSTPSPSHPIPPLCIPLSTSPTPTPPTPSRPPFRHRPGT